MRNVTHALVRPLGSSVHWCVMSLRRCDRYLLRQMLGPFLLALAGLALFILLNLILRLSELMVDRGIGLTQLLRLLIFWMPELIAWAIPMAALFAVFLGLGRLEHDREIMALESIGVSLRRILLPLLIAAVGLSFLTFAVYNWAMPASKQAAQRTYREILFSQSVPRISANTFFTGPNDQHFYVRQYDADDGSVHDVLIYDVTGQLFPQAESRITMVTADSGIWTGENWELSTGRMYGFNQEGALIYSGTFEEMSIPVAQTADQIWSQSKSPTEMGIRELISRIGRARDSGLPINQYIVELHQRFALPLSAVLFVLVGGAVSLMFGSRSRSTGIIIGLLLIGLYQGTYLWTQALGRRGAMNPTLAAWIPNLLFGAIGILLFLWVDRLASRDMWNRLRNRLPFLTSILLVGIISMSSMGQDVPLHLECDDLFISADRSEIIAQGSVHALLEDAELQADSLYLLQSDDDQWHMEATGEVSLDFGDFNLTGDTVIAEVLISEGGARTRSLESIGFRGQSNFENSSGQEHTLYFHGESGLIALDDEGELDFIEIRNGELTTCNCCDLPFQSQPYTLRANRLLFYPDRMIVVFGLTGRIGGVSTLWLPVYVQPLDETLESPLFPAIGRSALRGWFLKWSVPFYFSESLYGSILLDYFSRFNELGGGLILRYSSERSRGDVNVYAFPAVVGDPEYRFSLDHSVELSDDWDGSASIDYSLEGELSSFTFAARVDGKLGNWNVSSSAIRGWKEEGEIITERLPEVSVSREAVDFGFLSISPGFHAGWVREWREGNLTNQATRWKADLDSSMESFRILGATVTPSLSVGSTFYSGTEDDLRSTLSIALPIERNHLSVVYNGTFISGDSPFDFDQIDARSHIGGSLSSSGSGIVDIDLDTGIDLITSSFDPLTASFSWGSKFDWRTTLTYDLSAAALEEIVLSMSWASDPYSIRWSLPFDATQNVLEPLSFEITAKSDPSELALSGTVDGGRLDSLSGSLSVQGASGWGATIRTSYDVDQPTTLANTRYGIFRDIGDCLRVGLERGGGEIWIYGSILAFPEAILRYAPESASIQFGD